MPRPMAPRAGPTGPGHILPRAASRLAPMQIRDLTAEDARAYRALSTGAFGGREQPEAPRPFNPGETAIGVDSSSLPGGVDGVIAAGARIRHDSITVGGGVATCGGIAGLAVHPAHRGAGLFGPLLTAVIARCRQEGLAFSMLYPSNPSIYHRYGYQEVARENEVWVPLGDLQRLRPVPGRRLVPVTEQTMPRLRALYRELTALDNGMLLREGPLFPDGLPGDGWSAVLLEDADGRDHGYLSWTRAAQYDAEEGLEVHEILGRTREDRLALLQALGSWSTVTATARLRLRTEDPVLDVLPSGRLRPAPGIPGIVMMRVIDTAAALQARPAPDGLEGEIRLVVEDVSVPEGTCRAAGVWTVRAHEGAISAHPIGSESASPGSAPGESADAASGPLLGEVRLDIHAASLLLSGGRSVADARRLGLDARADAGAARFFDALVAGPRPSVLDAF